MCQVLQLSEANLSDGFMCLFRRCMTFFVGHGSDVERK